MSIQFQLRRGTTAQIAAITPAAGEILYDTTLGALVTGDGATVGGKRLPFFDSSGRIGIGTTAPAALLHVIGAIAIRMADSATDATTKQSRFVLSHYTNAQAPVGLIYAISDSSNNTIDIGGGSSAVNAATAINFLTAANNTTPTGTTALSINSAQQILHTVGSASAPSISFLGDTNTGFFDVSTDIIGFACGGSEMARLNGSGHFLIGTTVDNGHLTVGGNVMPEADNTRNLGSASFRWANSFVAQVVATKARITTSQTPATSGAAGTQGDFAWDASYFYICTATNTWRRVAHASW